MMKNAIKTVGVLIIKNNEVLLVKHGQAAEHLSGKYGLPAGRVDADEELIQAACRELKEETGLTVNVTDLMLIPYEWFADMERKDGVKSFSMKVFAAKNFHGQLSYRSNETIPEWVNLENVKSLNLLPNIEDIISRGQKLMIK